MATWVTWSRARVIAASRLSRCVISRIAPAAGGLRTRVMAGEREPGQHGLLGGLETVAPVDGEGLRVVGAGPDHHEGRLAVAEEADRLPDERRRPPGAPRRRHDVELGHLALQPVAGVEEDAPAEADGVVLLVAGHEDHVVPPEVGFEGPGVAGDLLPGLLGMVVAPLVLQPQLDKHA